MSEQEPNLYSGDAIHSDSDDDEFEFAVAGGDGTHPEPPPVYPVFDRSLLLDLDPVAPLADLRSGSNSSSSSSSSSSSAADDYFAWGPDSPDRCKKSSSTGSAASASRGFRMKDLVSFRSRSDGNDRFAFVKPNPNPNPNLRRERKDVKPGEMDLLTAHRLFYGGGKGVKGSRAYLPHRPGSVRLFANGNGLSRTMFPFLE